MPVAVPGPAVSPGIRICSLLKAAGTTVIALLEAESASASPAVRCAIRVSDSALVYWTPQRVCELVPAVIVPVLFEMIPVPDGLSVTLVPTTTFGCVAPRVLREDVTEKLVPAVTLPPGTDVTWSFDAAAALTTTLSRSAPAALIVPSVTATIADSALNSFIEPPTLATPLAKVIAVAEPKLIGAAALFVTVGAVAGLVLLFAPLNVRLWLPV